MCQKPCESCETNVKLRKKVFANAQIRKCAFAVFRNISQAFANMISQAFASFRANSQIWFRSVSQAFASFRNSWFRKLSQGFARIRKWTFASIRQGYASAKIMVFRKDSQRAVCSPSLPGDGHPSSHQATLPPPPQAHEFPAGPGPALRQMRRCRYTMTL